MFKRILPRALALILSAMFFVTLFCPLLAVSADEKTFRITEGNIVIGAEGAGLYVSVGEKRTTLSADTVIVIEGNSTTTQNTIQVKDNVTANIKLSGVRIDTKAFLKAPIELCGAEKVTLTLSGANTLSAGKYMAALQVGRYAKLSILGGGSLTARGGMGAAGIGGGWSDGVAGAPCGDIQIGGSVSVYSVGGDYGAGIGGGEGGNAASVTITDHASVKALGGKHASGIGSGSTARCGQIAISGSASVEALGGDYGAGIGGGYASATAKITLSASASVRARGGKGAAGIGGGKDGSATMISLSDNVTVRARGGEGAAGIGAGENAPLSVGVSISGLSTVFSIGGDGGAGIGGTNHTAGNLTLTDSVQVDAIGGKGAAGLGSGKDGNVLMISIDSRALINAYGGLSAAAIGTGENGSYGKISIFGSSSVYALGGKGGAGIGGGKNSTCGEMRLYGDTAIVAQGGNFGAGIGTGAKDTPDFAPSAGNLYIYGNASIRAAGGKDASGIGGGQNAAGGRVIVADSAKIEAFENITVAPEKESVEDKANYDRVTALIDSIRKDYKEFYTEESVKLLEEALNEVVYDLPASKQAQVDAYADKILYAINVLVEKPITYTVSASAESYQYGSEILISWKGVDKPGFSVVILKKGATYGEETLDEAWGVALGKPILSFSCVSDDSEVLAEKTVSLALGENHFLRKLCYTSLPEGEYTVHLCKGEDHTSVASADFKVTKNEALADYTALRAELRRIPTASSEGNYDAAAWTNVKNTVQEIKANLPLDQQAAVDALTARLKAAIDALLATEATAAEASVHSTRFFTLPDGTKETYTLSNLTHTASDEVRLILTAGNAPEAFAWGLIPLQSANVETPDENSVVSAINHVITPADITVGSKDASPASSLPASKIGAGAGCSMQGGFSITDSATFNGTTPNLSVRLEYGASIGTLVYHYSEGELFALPENISCPGYVFKGWSTDESGKNPVSGSFTLATDLTFYAHWDVIPVSIDPSFKFSSGILSERYEDTIRLKEASTNYTVSLTAGSLPNGLALEGTTGTISGIPTDLGTYTFTLRISDANGTTTDAEYSISIFETVEMTFTFYTAQNEHAATDGEILFHYSYYDRGNGALMESKPINITELLKENPEALQPGSVDSITLTVGAFVGEPATLYFENSVEDDGWRVEKVVISSPGGGGMSAFEKTYPMNTWVGNVDEVSFFESGAFIILIILLIILLSIVGIILFLRLRNNRPPQDTPPGDNGKETAENKAAQDPPSVPKPVAKPRTGAPTKAKAIPQATPRPRPHNVSKAPAKPQTNGSAPRPAAKPAPRPRPVQRPTEPKSDHSNTPKA